MKILKLLGALLAFLSVGFLARRLLFGKKPKRKEKKRKFRSLLSRATSKAFAQMGPRSKSVLLWFLSLLDKVCISMCVEGRP